MAGRACDISGLLSTPCSAKLILAIYRWFCCCHFWFSGFSAGLPERWALTLIFLFIAVPVGLLFGTSFTNYVKWSARGFADPAAYILFFSAILPIVGARSGGPNRKFMPAFFGALLLALAILMKPIVVPAAAVLLGGAGLYSLFLKAWPRLAGLCIGFIPVFSMALHNWYFGHVFVLFSSNASHPDVLTMPPSAWLKAALFSGDYPARAVAQVANWLSGPAESYATIPLNAAGVAMLIYVVARGRRFDPWLRLIGAAALAQHGVALFYNGSIGRYHFLTWFLTMLVDTVFMHEVGMGWLKQRYPVMSACLQSNRLSRRLASGLARLQKVSA